MLIASLRAVSMFMPQSPPQVLAMLAKIIEARVARAVKVRRKTKTILISQM
jgi:hypothetical protein